MFCREQVAQLRDTWPEIQSKGAHLVVVGNGQAYHAQHINDEYQLPFTLLTDPDLKAYAAAGLRRSVLATLNPWSAAHAVRSWVGGHTQKDTQGDNWQQGGVFVITPDEEVQFSYVSQEAGDHPSPAQILKGLSAAA